MSDKKRAWEGSGDTNAAKKLRRYTSSNATSSGSVLSGDALIAQKRAEINAKLAAMKKKTVGASSATPTFATPSAAAATSSLPSTDDVARRIAEAKKRLADTQSKLAVKDNPYMSALQTGKKKAPAAPEPLQQGAGLKMAAHPILLDDTPTLPQSKKDRYKPMQPKFASIKANTRNVATPPPAPTPIVPIEIQANPYASAATAPGESGFDGAPKERVGRQFRFNPKGKYVQIANQVRQEAQLEQLKQRIAESAKKAGLDSEFETLEKNIRRDAPPAAEWWDAALLPNKDYADLEQGIAKMNIRNETSPITMYIQHPIPIPAPGDKDKVTMKPLKLTKKASFQYSEQKKVRKQRRQAELQDKRDRIRMGLIPPDPPKVRLANLMKVLTSDAVQDPTRVEARVRREVAMRKHQHEKMNAERKLTDEQRREKIETKKMEEEKKGIYGAVFKVKTLADPAQRFKVRKNAEQMNLSGVCIFNPSFSMVYVEGAPKFIRQYKRLMLHRIVWTEAARERGNEDVELQEDEEMEGKSKGKAPATSTEGEHGQASLEDNQCWLVWEGMLRDRSFNNFKPKSCPTDGLAKEALGQKLAGYWDQAKNWKPEEEELF
ncbi:pre-mRNA processing factor 3-domain-containing protein [Daedaleopsis nitida]|nr:pre-mRNA processing factor 3-domain-containing protein [Daedaleopsis nitida]